MSAINENRLITALQRFQINDYPSIEFDKCINIVFSLIKLIEKAEQVSNNRYENLLPGTGDNDQKLKCLQNLFIKTLINLLRSIIARVEKYDNEEAVKIKTDFDKINKYIIFLTKRLEAEELKKVVVQFIRKIVLVMETIDYLNYNQKIHLYNVMKVIVIDLGKQPNFTTSILHLMMNKISSQKNEVKTSDHYFTLIAILKGVINAEVLIKVTQDAPKLLAEVRGFLEVKYKECSSHEEKYLIQHILRAFEIQTLDLNKHNQASSSNIFI